MARPTLHDIAAMPFPASLNAMRQHYNPAWGKPVSEKGLQRFKVEIEYEYTIRDRQAVQVEAYSEEEAIEIAADKLADEQDGFGDFDVIRSQIIGEPASVDTRPEGGDSLLAPFTSGAVAQPDAQTTPSENPS